MGNASARNALVRRWRCAGDRLRCLPEHHGPTDPGSDGWRTDDLRPYLDRAEQLLALRTVERGDLSPWHEAFADAAGDATIFHVVNARGPIRWNAAFAYLDPARGDRT